jgi:hypothetical protein
MRTMDKREELLKALTEAAATIGTVTVDSPAH